MKKFISLVLVVFILFSHSACRGRDEEDDIIRVGMVTDTGGINDGSFNQTSWAGLEKAEKELGIEINYLESKTDADYETNIETFLDEEFDLIIGVGYMLASAIREAAIDNPDRKFAIIDDSTNADLPNVACLMFRQEQAAYLVGYVAGLATVSNNVGFVLGMSTGLMNRFGYGFAAGVTDANPTARIQMANANAFTDPSQGRSIATSMITNGADVLFHAAGGTGLGMIEACKEANIMAIGADSDQSKLAPANIITSALKRVDTASYEVAKSVAENRYQGGIIWYDLDSEGVDYVASDLLSEDIKRAVEEVKAGILSGNIIVPDNQADFEAKYGNIYTLD
ncbi:MAG: BMP family ABC transporter substrate-binding protein [Lachnospiraceae bacterium]|nr:BMP family ABC transporter substrate-binding protein [Lachnospiraceae bacterium]